MNALATLFPRPLSVSPEITGLSPEAEAIKADLVLSAGKVSSVTCAQEQDTAASVSRDLRTYVKQVRALGLEFRRPLTTFAAKVKEAEDAHVAGLETEQKRIERLVLDFTEAERRRVAEEERKRAEEVERLNRERLAAEEKARKLAEKAETPKQEDAAEEAAAAAFLAEQQVQAAIIAPLPQVAKAAGMSTRKVMRWEVTDINALVKARPDLCKIEAKGSAILAVCVPEVPVPGLKLWWETTINTRTR